MRHRLIASALAFLACWVASLPAQSSVFPVDDLRPGMVAVGRTVFEGERLDEFKATILGVLRNVIGPRRNLILARLEGGPLANTGVIAGMSGSPVYIDGRLVGRGARIRSGEFSKEPIAGITPFDEMLEAATLPAHAAAGRARGAADADHARRACAIHCGRPSRGRGRSPIARTDVQVVSGGLGSLGAGVGTMLRPIATPLTLGGLRPGRDRSPVAAAFRDQGFVPVMAGGAGSAGRPVGRPVQGAAPLRAGDPDRRGAR